MPTLDLLPAAVSAGSTLTGPPAPVAVRGIVLGNPVVASFLELLLQRRVGDPVSLIARPGPIVAKDGMRPEEAALGGVIVSNHGDRQLDHLPATIDALPSIAGQRPGAKAVLVGRAHLYRLAAGASAIPGGLQQRKKAGVRRARDGRRSKRCATP